MPNHFAEIRPVTKTYRVYFGEELVLETNQVLELQEHFGDRTFPAAAYFAPEAVAGLTFAANDHASTCPLKGEAKYLDFHGVENAVWTYPQPKPEVAAIAGHFGFDTTKGFRIEAAG